MDRPELPGRDAGTAWLRDWSDYFGLAWRRRHAALTEIVATESDLSRALARFARHCAERPIGPVGDTFEEMPEFMVKSVPALDRLEMRQRRVCLGVEVDSSAYHMFDRGRLIADFAQGHDCIFDMGGGYGRALFEAWLAGAPADARYINAEATESGGVLAGLLGTLAPRMRLASVPFRFEDPDFSALAGARAPLVISSWAIHMAEPVAPDLFDRLGALGVPVDCLLIEPLGHQIGAADSTARELSDKRRYNRGFTELLQAAAQSGRVEILSIVAALDGEADEPNSQATVFALAVNPD